MIRLCLQPELGFGNLHMVACIRVTSSFRLAPSDGALVPWAPSPWSPSACVSDVVSFQSQLRVCNTCTEMHTGPTLSAADYSSVACSSCFCCLWACGASAS
jgi:hypothetical protein